jgi:hypothetical protein
VHWKNKKAHRMSNAGETSRRMACVDDIVTSAPAADGRPLQLLHGIRSDCKCGHSADTFAAQAASTTPSTNANQIRIEQAIENLLF